MRKARLSKGDVRDLLQEYQSKRKKYEFYLEETDSAIKKLEKALGTAVDEDEKPTRRGRKPKVVKATPKKRGRKAKRGRPKLAKVKPFTKVTRKTRKKVAKKAVRKVKTRAKVKLAKPKVLKKRGRKPSKKAPRKFTLSNWDNFLLKTLADEKLALIKSEFVDAAKHSSELATSGMTPGQIEIKITQSLHKLSNKKKLITKVKYYGKGYAYALKDWITRKGDLMKIYRR
jgi:hypothetical protein